MVHLGCGPGWPLVYSFLLFSQHRRKWLYFEVPVLAVGLFGMTKLILFQCHVHNEPKPNLPAS
jgi:hypothetical protein